jgi:hypothetical protein
MDIVKQKLISIQRNKEFVTILGYNTDGKDSVVDKFDNCVFTDISFDVSPDSGYAIYPNISIEQVNVVRVKVTQASGDVITVKAVANQGAGVDGKGNINTNKKSTNGNTKPNGRQEGVSFWEEQSHMAQSDNATLHAEVIAKQKRNAAQ